VGLAHARPNNSSLHLTLLATPPALNYNTELYIVQAFHAGYLSLWIKLWVWLVTDFELGERGADIFQNVHLLADIT